MSQITDGQDASVIGGKADAAALGAGGVNTVPVGTATVTTPVFVTNVAQQLSATRNVNLYINVVTAAALTIAYGPTSAAATVLNASAVDGIGLINVSVPVGWYVKITGTIANLAITAVAVA